VNGKAKVKVEREAPKLYNSPLRNAMKKMLIKNLRKGRVQAMWDDRRLEGVENDSEYNGDP
jgi:hypothetical protein